ncbi:conserved hypothetical protein [Bathymodiolus platifrons methanotrophic gill symbiont]|uniref:hypothetical protein n=1 Tax=Bathymodiolus platifrons methanotrophic gill symbiont TaxID=113268 RepID=UPI000B420D6A|nr:hypothetical protein [Bathymodiolus platifrons methanotrophic gill symbiont]TXL02019.1 hypothetical protein BMR02_00160 [Methylococcaceae bacterium HT1]TXL13630.1 hypothetical protein BMR04_14120 [Methylococcaceae bacterium HT3]TXL22845.1 hypothetical protein BMR03_05875 [Methylococcaceae bacterium HT2]GAW86296.1 conserved hypothetical protein [Bathymodiolus platifrons methanotrophic gill symbiont]
MSLKAERNKKKIANKVRKGFRGYPAATIAYYGPTNKKATKVAVGIVVKENAVPAQMKTWVSTEDVRNDSLILEEILGFIADYSVKSIAMTDAIIGCPHQEGIDYPDGEECQECTFWKGLDRWTGERIH